MNTQAALIITLLLALFAPVDVTDPLSRSDGILKKITCSRR
jgi:hypothetical protein